MILSNLTFLEEISETIELIDKVEVDPEMALMRGERINIESLYC